MEQNNSEVLPTQPVQPVQPTQSIKSNNSLVIILSVLLLVAVSIAGFFALQTQKLTKQLAQYQSVIPLPLPTEAPAEVDGETVDWKTYADEKYHFSFKYPSSWQVNEYNPVENIHETRIQKGEHKIEIIRYITPESCYFSDYKPPEQESSNPYYISITYDAYKTINHPNYLMRRITSEDLINDSTSQNIWKVCIFNNSTKSFSTSPWNHDPAISAIWYYIPKNPLTIR